MISLRQALDDEEKVVIKGFFSFLLFVCLSHSVLRNDTTNIPVPFKCKFYSWEFLVGPCLPVLQILTLFQTKKCCFLHPFSDKTFKIHTRFQTWPLGRNYVLITQIRAQTKHSSKPFRIRIFLLLCYSFGIEAINTFIHSRSSLENHTRFQTKMGKVYTRFHTKTAQKPYPIGRHLPIQLI